MVLSKVPAILLNKIILLVIRGEKIMIMIK